TVSKDAMPRPAIRRARPRPVPAKSQLVQGQPRLGQLMTAYQANPSWGFQSIFREGVSGAPSLDHGSGAGAAFQRLCKISQAFAVEAAAVGLRAIGGKAPHGHWGPISRKEADIRPEADALLAQVQQMVEAPIVAPRSPCLCRSRGPRRCLR